jgi:hypothetical protein
MSYLTHVVYSTGVHYTRKEIKEIKVIHQEIYEMDNSNRCVHAGLMAQIAGWLLPLLNCVQFVSRCQLPAALKGATSVGRSCYKTVGGQKGNIIE